MRLLSLCFTAAIIDSAKAMDVKCEMIDGSFTLKFLFPENISRDQASSHSHANVKIICQGSEKLCKGFPKSIDMINNFDFLWLGLEPGTVIGFDASRMKAFFRTESLQVDVADGIPCVYL